MRDILLLDDEALVLRSLKRLLARQPDWNVEAFEDPYLALRRLQAKSFDVVISDYRMPLMDGAAFLSEVYRLQPRTMRLILSAHADRDALVTAVNEARIFRFMEKPWSEPDLLAVLEEAFAARDEILEDQMLAREARRARSENCPGS
ncbi:MAG: response regulator [Aquisalimonadaceae bacterium]